MTRNSLIAIIIFTLAGCASRAIAPVRCLEDCASAAIAADREGYSYRIWMGPAKNAPAYHCQTQVKRNDGDWVWVHCFDGYVYKSKQDDWFDPQEHLGLHEILYRAGFYDYYTRKDDKDEKKN